MKMCSVHSQVQELKVVLEQGKEEECGVQGNIVYSLPSREGLLCVK
jgi:hypothetical protein